MLLGDLAALFPPKADVHVSGSRCSSGGSRCKDDYFARLAIGVIVEFDEGQGLTKVILLGSLRLDNPELKRIFDVQVDLVGVIDLVRTPWRSTPRSAGAA